MNRLRRLEAIAGVMCGLDSVGCKGGPGRVSP